jgi:APA family basic amino acid/polyamine antiporter
MPADSRPRIGTIAAPRIGTITAASILISNAVGSGIFTTTGFLSRDLGDPLLILGLWALGGAIALAGAMSYSELGAAMPRVGGEYVYLRHAFGPLTGFLSGWTSFTVGFGAAIAAGAGGGGPPRGAPGAGGAPQDPPHYVLTLVPGDSPLHRPSAIAIALVWALTLVHALGVEHGGRFQRAITALKVGGIGALLVAAFALGQGDWSQLSQRTPGSGSAGVALIFVLYSYSGWNAAAYVAGEIRDPERSLPRAMIGGTLFVTLLYLALNAMYFYALPVSELAAEPVLPVARKAAVALLGGAAGDAVAIVLAVSLAGALSSMIWAGPRVTLAMARDGVAPPGLAATSETGAPVRAVVLQSLWVTLLVASGSFEQLVVYSGFALALFSAAAVLCVVVLRRREPDRPRPYRVGLYPWLPLAYVAASLWIAAHAAIGRPLESLLSAATVAAGLPAYWWWMRDRANGGPRPPD